MKYQVNLDDFIASLAGRQVTVIGVGVSNRPLIALLKERGIELTARDKDENSTVDGVRMITGAAYLDGIDEDVIFRSPGVRPDKIKAKPGAVIISEMEAFFQVCPCPIVAVTGSDGKTTTTTLIAEMLRAAGKTVWLGGNIGRPLFADSGKMKPDDIAVVELSSFQLMDMKHSAHVAVVTNVAPNHLDWHLSLDEYKCAKQNVYRHQAAGDILVVNADNEVTRSYAQGAVGTVRTFSRNETVDKGCCFDGEFIWLNGEKLMPRSELRLPGMHNVENFMAAAAAVYHIAGREACISVGRSFGGVEHRIEPVRTLRGVRYYNDSIASSPSRTAAGLMSFDQKLILIAGGYDKHIPYDDLGKIINERVKLLILTGDTAPKIRDACLKAGNGPEIMQTDDLRGAVLAAADRAEEGDIVIMSPASASFDKFKNFEQRGNYFKEIVAELK